MLGYGYPMRSILFSVVQEFECALTREIVELIDREADLLNRGRKDKSLDGMVCMACVCVSTPSSFKSTQLKQKHACWRLLKCTKIKACSTIPA